MIPLRNSILLCTLLLLGAARADVLDWNSKDQTVDLALTSEQAEVKFQGKNTSKKTIVIHSISTGCGCTSAKFDRKVIGPEQSVVITIAANVATSLGDVKRQLIVFYDTDSDEDLLRDRLTYTIHIKSPFNVNLNTLLWKFGEKLNEKTIKISISDLSLNPYVAKVSSSNSKIKVSLERISENECTMNVVPCEGPEDGVVEIECEITIGQKVKKRCLSLPVKIE